ncbi:hypothetical protein BH10ACT7_BH10ACT7_25890 [soil metagenome]
MSNPYEGLQEFVSQLPELVQPLIIAALGAIPYVEGEGAAALGVIVGINPIVAGLAGAAGNILCVVLVVLAGSRIREAVVTRRSRKTSEFIAQTPGDQTRGNSTPGDLSPNQTRKSKGRARLRRWLLRFGVPGASLLAPLALPTQLTAATLVASGVSKGWVILWQVIAIVLWTSLVTAAATGVIQLLGW